MTLDNGIFARAAVPSGASTGRITVNPPTFTRFCS